jgi:hypothetical protein
MSAEVFRVSFLVKMPTPPLWPWGSPGYKQPSGCGNGNKDNDSYIGLVCPDYYRGNVRSVLLVAASGHPKDLLSVLQAHVSLKTLQLRNGGPAQSVTEQIEILQSQALEAPALGSAAAFVYRVKYQIRQLNPNPIPLGGAAVNLYSNPPATALVLANSPQGVAAVLAANISLGSNQVLDILNVEQISTGSESSVWS